jgi:hypothetical protein
MLIVAMNNDLFRIIYSLVIGIIIKAISNGDEIKLWWFIKCE